MDIFLLILIIAMVAVLLFRKKMQDRGKRFVRAYYFLKKVDSGLDIESANRAAQMILRKNEDLVNQHDIIMEANNYIISYYNGMQLPLINHAISKGFRDQSNSPPKAFNKHVKYSDSTKDTQRPERKIYDFACEYHEKFLASEIDEIDDVRFSAAALGALDGTVQALGQEFSEVEMFVMGSAIIARQLTEFSRVDKQDTDRIADVTFNAMNSDVHHEIIEAAGRAAYAMHKKQRH